MVDDLQADIRGLGTAFPKVRLEHPLSRMARVRTEALPPSGNEDSPDLASPGLDSSCFFVSTLVPSIATSLDASGATISIGRVLGYTPESTSSRSRTTVVGSTCGLVTAPMRAQMKPHNSRATATTATL